MKSSQHLFVVTEFVSGGDLYSLLERKGRIPEAEARYYFQQLISALEYCHRQAIVHRDLKPENLLLDDSSVIKIADFGLATQFRDGLYCLSSCGSPNYAAPEVVSCSTYCGPEVDIWSAGVILFALVSGRLPFDDPSFPVLFKRIRKAEFKLPIEFSDGLKDLILRILNPDPIARITIQQLKCHPWFSVALPLHLTISPSSLKQFVRAPTPQDAFEGFDLEIMAVCTELPTLEPLDGLALVRALKDDPESQYRVSYEILADFKEKQLKLRLYELNTIPRPIFALSRPRPTLTKTRDGSNVLNSPTNWTYGFRCPATSLDLLSALFTTLQQQDLEWRQVNHNTLRIRSKSIQDSRSPECSPVSLSKRRLQPSSVKFDMTVYMVLAKQFEDSYVLDFRFVGGQACVFLGFCAKLHEVLRASLFNCPE
jgi:5'-AMP-activated protein kinase catalytic alpha subunit